MAHTLLAHSVDKIYKMNKLLSNLPSLHMHNCLMQVKHRPVLVLVELQLESVAGKSRIYTLVLTCSSPCFSAVSALLSPVRAP